MLIKPINKNVYVELLPSENVSSTGLYLGTKKSDIETGTVLAASTSDLFLVGDKVIFNKHAVTKVDESLLIIKEEFILGIIQNKD